jgi:hypothetical protein
MMTYFAGRTEIERLREWVRSETGPGAWSESEFHARFLAFGPAHPRWMKDVWFD